MVHGAARNNSKKLKARTTAPIVTCNVVVIGSFWVSTVPDDINKIDDALPTNPDIGNIIYYLQGAATQNGMMIKDLFLSKSSSGNTQASTTGKIKDIVFSIDLLGDYSSLEKFMISLEKSSRVFEITSISFGSSTQAPAAAAKSQFQIQQTFSFNMQIKTNSY